MMEAISSILIEGYHAEKELQSKNKVDAWRSIRAAHQNNMILQAEVIGIETLENEKNNSKTCAVVSVGDIRGYITLEEMNHNGMTLQQLRELVGQEILFQVTQCISTGEDENGMKMFVASRRKALERSAAITLQQIHVGATIKSVVRHVSGGQVRADIGGIEVTIPISEMSHGWIDDLTQIVKVGDHLDVKVLEINKELKEVKVSRKALLPDPWQNVMKNYKKNSEYLGKVSGVQDYGIFVNLETGVDSLARHLKYQNVKRGDSVLVRILDIRPEKKEIESKIVSVLNQ